MTDSWFKKFRRRVAIRRRASAARQHPQELSAQAWEALHLQQRQLHALASARHHELFAMLGDDAIDELLQLYRSGLSPQQITTLDRAISTLAAMHTPPPPVATAGFSLTGLLDELRSLVAADAIQHGCELHTLVYDDLPARFHGDPNSLRTLLLRHCSAMLRGIESGALIIRAMIDESDHRPTDDEQQQTSGHSRPARVCITLQGGCDTRLTNPPVLAEDSHELAAAIGAWLQPYDPAEQQLALVVSLEADDRYTPPPLPAPLDDRVVEIFHPCAAARHSLEGRLRGMNLYTHELEQLGDTRLGGDQVATLLLALPVGADYHTAFSLLTARTTALPPLLVLSDQPPPPELPAGCRWLAASVDDQSLYQHIFRLLRALPAAAGSTPTDIDPMLSEELTRMLAAEFPATLAHLRQCARDGDRETLKTIAHKLKGGSAYCGASGLHEVARTLDQLALTATPRHIDYLLERLGSETCGLPDPDEK